jgi:hypothetical protein
MERKKRSNSEGIKLGSKLKNRDKSKWQKPTLEDVSGKIMAQPYIRFT